jgi:hypothetical protein
LRSVRTSQRRPYRQPSSHVPSATLITPAAHAGFRHLLVLRCALRSEFCPCFSLRRCFATLNHGSTPRIVYGSSRSTTVVTAFRSLVRRSAFAAIGTGRVLRRQYGGQLTMAASSNSTAASCISEFTLSTLLGPSDHTYDGPLPDGDETLAIEGSPQSIAAMRCNTAIGRRLLPLENTGCSRFIGEK